MTKAEKEKARMVNAIQNIWQGLNIKTDTGEPVERIDIVDDSGAVIEHIPLGKHEAKK